MSLTQEDLNALGDLLDSKLEPIEDAIVRVNKRLTIIEGDIHQINLKIDEIREWTMLDRKDNPFIRPARKAIA